MAGPKISLAQQLEEAERELEQRAKVYPRLVGSGAMRQSVADFHVNRMKAVAETLRWLQANETAIKARLDRAAALEEETHA
jgi:hypothetical protein